MKNFAIVLFMVALSGCTTGPERYAGNAGALGEYARGMANRAYYEQKKIEAEAYRDGYNLGQPNVSVYGAFRGSNVRGGFGYQSQPYGYGWGAGYYPLDWRSQIRPPCRRW